jgi:acetyl esterase
MSLDPEVQPILELLSAMELPPMDQMEPAMLREFMGAMPVENPTPVANVSDRLAGDVPIRVYTPPGEGPHPLMVYYHGGGWVVGDLDTHDEPCRQFAVTAGAVVVAVDYRLAPEAKCPAAAEDSYAATCWAVANAAELGADGSRLIVAGDSAGGNLAAVVSMMARDRDGPAIAHQLLIYPVTDNDFERPSYRENAEGYYLTRDMMQWFWRHYLENDAQAADPVAAPLHGNLAGLPPATVITAGYDPLRDEGIAYAEALAAAGVPVEHRLFEGMIHGFVTLPGLSLAAVAVDYLCQRALASLPD